MSDQVPSELALLSFFGALDSEDEEALFAAPPKLSSREERIQRSIDDGKHQYGAKQVFTPFDWFSNPEIVGARSQDPKTLLRAKEHTAEALYFKREFRACLDLCLELLPEPYDVNVSRELIDMALRACLKLGDATAGEKLARGCRAMWVSSPSLAMSSGQVLAMCNLHADAFKALLCTTPRAIHHPCCSAMATSLASWAASLDSSPSAAAIASLARDAAHFATLSAPHFTRPLFGPPMARGDGREGAGQHVHVYLSAEELDDALVTLAMDERTKGRAHAAWGKMRSSGRAGAETVDSEDEGDVRKL